MTFDLRQVASDTAKDLTVPCFGQEIEITYDRARLTPRLWRAFQGVNGRTDDVETLVKFLGAVLTEWDTMSDGEPVGLDPESMSDVPFVVLAAVLTRIQGDMTETADAEGNGSTPISV